jgi:hypothetical protein
MAGPRAHTPHTPTLTWRGRRRISTVVPGGRPRELVSGGDPVEVGHTYIRQHHVGCQAACLGDGLPPCRCPAADLYLRIGSKQLDEPCSHQVVVVSDEKAGQVG